MLACWAGPTSGDAYSQGYPAVRDAADVLIRLVYAKDATTFQQMSYVATTQIWSMEEKIGNVNAHVTPACYNSDQGTVDYFMFVGLDDTVNVYWFVRLVSLK